MPGEHVNLTQQRALHARELPEGQRLEIDPDRAGRGAGRAWAIHRESRQRIDRGPGLGNRRQYEIDGDLASLRELPRFKELMQRL